MRTRLVVVALALGVAVSCEPPFAVPINGFLRVTVTTSGGDLDLDGYTLQVTGVADQALGLNQTVVIAQLDTGAHQVELGGVAANCTVTGDNPRSVRVVLGDTVRVTFPVGCVATGVQVSIATTGIDIDPDGYAVSVDAAPAVAVPVNGTLTVTRLSAGSHTVTMSGVAANCPVGGTNPRSVTLAAGEVQPVSFAVACGATSGTVQVTTQTAGIDVDPNGYTVQLDNGTPVALTVNGTLRFNGVTGGDHQVTLAGVAGNCPVGGSNPRTVSMTTGGPKRDTVSTTFQVSCGAATARIEVTAATTGIDLDSGYTVQVDGGTAVPLSMNGTAGFDGLSGGDHIVAVAGVAANCLVGGLNPRTLTLTTGGATRDTARTTFQMTCSATSGRIEVTVAPTGLDLPPNGFTVTVDGGTPKGLLTGTVSFDGVSGGSHQVTLAGATANCTVGGSNPRSVSVTTGGATRDTARTTFDVSCLATTGAIEVTAATSGPDQDGDGYIVRVDNLTPVALPTNGVVTILGISVGSHSVLVDGVAGNCSISGANPRMVSVTAGGTTRDTARTTYTLTCAATTGSIAVTTATTGIDLDADGYFVRVLSSGVNTYIDLGVNATQTISKLLPGAYTVRLEGVSENCTPDQFSQPATVAVGQTTAVSFAVSCATAAQLAFTYTVAGNTDVYLIKTNGADLTRLTTDTAWDAIPAWAPGGAKIAFASQRDASSQIYVMNADGTGQTRLTNTTGGNLYPAWSHDGTKIAFTSWRDGQAEIYVMNANGSNVVRLTNNPAYDANPVWSPDGTKIAFESSRVGTTHIFVMNADGSNVTQVGNVTDGESQPDWSPDGTKIAFTSGYCDYYYCYSDIYVMSANGTGVTRLTFTSSASEPAWSANGNSIAFANISCDYYSCYSTISVIRADGTDQTPVVGDGAADPAWRR